MQSFNEMLNDVYSQLGTSESGSDIFMLPDPEIEKGTTRVVWKNPKAFLRRTHTESEHLLQFLIQQSGKKINWFSKSVSDGIIFHDKKISKNDIIYLMKKYVQYYILCKFCNNSKTKIHRDIVIKKYQLKCLVCNSEYTVDEVI